MWFSVPRSAFSVHKEIGAVAAPSDKFAEIVRQTQAYLEILRDGGFVYADGTFEPMPVREAPKPMPKRPPQQRKAAPAPLSPEERARLKAALTDPYAHLAPPASRPSTAPPAKPAPSPQPPAAAQHPAAAKGKSLVTLRDRAEGVKAIAEANDLDRIRYLVSGCHMCGLVAGRTLTVPGEGNPRAALMFIGEGPGYHEDIQGQPFVGRAGALLTQMIQAMGLRREDVFITNIVKCRPPGNRDPLPDEIKACEPFLKRQIELIGPRIICTLGRISVQGLLRDTTPITQLRGKWRSYAGIPLMPTFHPAYLLRNAGGKPDAWKDLQAIMARLADLKTGG